jgi:excisionase family DNA binding protein
MTFTWDNEKGITQASLNVRELAALLGVAPITIYKMVQKKEIPHTRIGTRIVFFKEKVEEWIEKNSVS